MKRAILTLSITAFGALAITPSLMAQSDPKNTACASQIMYQDTGSGTFTKKRYTVNGSWTMGQDCLDTTIRFGDDFKTKGGPDLKVYLSPKPLSELDGTSALDGAVKIGVLKSNKGGQSYIVPHATDISAYKSVIIQCEAFSVLWGGFDLPAQETD